MNCIKSILDNKNGQKVSKLKYVLYEIIINNCLEISKRQKEWMCLKLSYQKNNILHGKCAIFVTWNDFISHIEMHSVYRAEYVFSCSLRYWNIPEAVCYRGRLANPRPEFFPRAPRSATLARISPQLFRFSERRAIQLLVAALPLRPLVFLDST